MHVVVAGASGFLGRHLTAELRGRGHRVTRLVRATARGVDESPWDPYAGRVDAALVGGADVVVNLAGAPLIGNPHSARWARGVYESRVASTRVLAEAIAASATPPVFLAQNGISYYGDHGAEPLTEEADSRGDALLTRVARDWQAATEPAAAAGARVVVLRTAPVMDRRSAPLKQQALLFRFGLGARLGSGEQYSPVISLRDWLAAALFLAEGDADAPAGPVNLCSPVTPTNAEFTRALAEAVHRPAFLVAPSAVLRPAAGRMAPELLGSLNTVPAALASAGFEFSDGDVRAVIDAALSTPR